MKFSEHIALVPSAIIDTLNKKQDFLPLRRTEKIHVIGSGSSYSQAFYLCQLINNHLPQTALWNNPYSFVRHTRFTEEDTFIQFTQEGKRNDNVCPLRYAKDCGGRTILFTANSETPLAQEADEVYWYAPEDDKVLVASMSYASGYAAALNYVNAQLRFLLMPEIKIDKDILSKRMQEAMDKNYKTSNDFSVFLYAGYAASVAIEGALKVNECLLQDSESYEIKHYSHGKHFVSWNQQRLFNVLYHKDDVDLVELYKTTIFENHHLINFMESDLSKETAVFEWIVAMLAFIVQSMDHKGIALEDIQIRDRIRIPHQFVY